MKRSMVFVLCAFLMGAVSLIGAPRVTSVDPTMASPGDSLAAAGTDLNEVELMFLTVGATDVPVEINGNHGESPSACSSAPKSSLRRR